MSALAVQSIARVTNKPADAVLISAQMLGWLILKINTPDGEIDAIDMDTVPPPTRNQLIEAVRVHGEREYVKATPQVQQAVIDRARQEIRDNKVISIEAVRQAALAKRRKQ